MTQRQEVERVVEFCPKYMHALVFGTNAYRCCFAASVDVIDHSSPFNCFGTHAYDNGEGIDHLCDGYAGNPAKNLERRAVSRLCCAGLYRLANRVRNECKECHVDEFIR